MKRSEVRRYLSFKSWKQVTDNFWVKGNLKAKIGLFRIIFYRSSGAYHAVKVHQVWLAWLDALKLKKAIDAANNKRVK